MRPGASCSRRRRRLFLRGRTFGEKSSPEPSLKISGHFGAPAKRFSPHEKRTQNAARAAALRPFYSAFCFYPVLFPRAGSETPERSCGRGWGGCFCKTPSPVVQYRYLRSTESVATIPLMFHSLATEYSAPLVSSSARTLPLIASAFFCAICASLSLPLMDTRM